MCVWVRISAWKKIFLWSPFVSTQKYSIHKYLSVFINKRNWCGREGFASLIQSLILYISLPKEGRECMRARTHNLPIMYVSCVAHVDSRRRFCVEFTLRVPDEYRVTVAAEDCRWKNFGREFRYTYASAYARYRARNWSPLSQL